MRLAEQHLMGGSNISLEGPALTGPPSGVGMAEAGLAVASLALEAAVPNPAQAAHAGSMSRLGDN